MTACCSKLLPRSVLTNENQLTLEGLNTSHTELQAKKLQAYSLPFHMSGKSLIYYRNEYCLA